MIEIIIQSISINIKFTGLLSTDKTNHPVYRLTPIKWLNSGDLLFVRYKEIKHCHPLPLSFNNCCEDQIYSQLITLTTRSLSLH